MYEVVFPGGNESVKIRRKKIFDSLLIESDAEHDAVPDELVMVIRYVPESPGFAQWSSIVRTPIVAMEMCEIFRNCQTEASNLPVFSDKDMRLLESNGMPSFSQVVVVRGAHEMKHFSSAVLPSSTYFGCKFEIYYLVQLNYLFAGEGGEDFRSLNKASPWRGSILLTHHRGT